jgi:hypothetical protein
MRIKDVLLRISDMGRSTPHRPWRVPPLSNIMLGGIRRARTLHARSQARHGPQRALTETVRDFNASTPAPDPVGKHPDLLHQPENGPVDPVTMWIENGFNTQLPCTTDGVDLDEESGEVRRNDGGTVPGVRRRTGRHRTMLQRLSQRPVPGRHHVPVAAIFRWPRRPSDDDQRNTVSAAVPNTHGVLSDGPPSVHDAELVALRTPIDTRTDDPSDK